ncbi:nucleotidyltransferase domain-containing protein [Candidatus Woesearchaeota archaeon]|nr:nucleotidyltransferase domain-containing protein [Candidatus Woesearchaeota archaeon]
MISLTKKEREVLLVLFKEFTAFYNANSISKILKISHVGAQKIFKRLLQENLVISKTIGKAITYKLNFNDNYVCQLIAFLLADEANSFKRWKEEFKELFKKDMIIMIFGSAVKDYAHAKDIDLMIVMENKPAEKPKQIKELNKILKKKEEILPKKLHVIKLTHQDLSENLKNRNTAIIDIVKNAIILHGQDKYVEMLKDVTII